MNDAGLHRRRSRSLLPSTWNAISSYWHSVSANANNIASSVCSVGTAVASTTSENDRHCEQIQWAGFGKLELDHSCIHHVLMLAYINGFQVWDVEEAKNVRELVSRRDGPVAFLCLQPRSCLPEPAEGSLKASHPLLLVGTGDSFNNGICVPGTCQGVHGASCGTLQGSSHFMPTLVRFYSLKVHSYVHTLRFRTAIYALRCSPRVVAVALLSQIYCFNSATLQSTFSVLTYPMPISGPGSGNLVYGALAVGPRWLAYAANQPVISTIGRISPQHLTPSPGVSPSTSPANGNLIAHYAKESSKQVAAGIFTLGDRGYKTLSKYCAELLPDGNISPGSGSPLKKGNNTGSNSEPDYAGTVVVRDLVTKAIIVQFKAHSSPLSALCFDPSGTLLVTASVHGHNLNVFRLTPSTGTSNGSLDYDQDVSHAHLYKLYRGLTNAVIQDITFSSDSHWVSVSSSRGTTHLFAISPYGGAIGSHTHASKVTDGKTENASIIPWWSRTGPLKLGSQSFPPPTITLSVVNRVKNGIGGWRGTIGDAAAVATGKAHASGAVASTFHDGGGHQQEFEQGYASLQEKLWVLCPSGYIFRYSLCPYADHVAGSNHIRPEMGNVGTGNACQIQLLKLGIEPLEKWDVCRRPSWVEREETIDCFSRDHDGDQSKLTSMAAEEMHSYYMSKAEVKVQTRQLPTWAKPNIQFCMMITDENDAIEDGELHGGEVMIEKIPIRGVEVRRKDLKPAFERLTCVSDIHQAPLREMVPVLQVAVLQNGIWKGEVVNSSNGEGCLGIKGTNYSYESVRSKDSVPYSVGSMPTSGPTSDFDQAESPPFGSSPFSQYDHHSSPHSEAESENPAFFDEGLNSPMASVGMVQGEVETYNRMLDGNSFVESVLQHQIDLHKQPQETNESKKDNKAMADLSASETKGLVTTKAQDAEGVLDGCSSDKGALLDMDNNEEAVEDVIFPFCEED